MSCDSIAKAISGLQGEVGRLMGEVSALRGEVSALKAELSGVAKKSDLAALGEQIQRSVKTYMDGIKAAVEAFYAGIQGILQTILSAILQLAGRGSNEKLDEVIALITRLISGLTGRLGAIESRLSELGAIRRAVDNLAGNVSRILDYVKSLGDIYTVLSQVRRYFPIQFPAQKEVSLDKVLNRLDNIASALSQVLSYVKSLGDIYGLLRKIEGFFPIKFPSTDLSRVLAAIERLSNAVSQVIGYVKSLVDIYTGVNRANQGINDLKGIVGKGYTELENKIKEGSAATAKAVDNNGYDALRNDIFGLKSQFVALVSLGVDRSTRVGQIQSKVNDIDGKANNLLSRAERTLALLSEAYNYIKSLVDINGKLNAIREAVTKNLGVLGGSEFPIEVPTSLLNYPGSSQTQSITNYASLIVWIVRQVDGLFGQFPIEIDVEDIDPLTNGKQSKRITLPNVAEAVSEIYALTLANQTDSQVGLNYLNRIAVEIIAAKNAAVVAQDYAKANAGYLGYKANPIKRKLPYAFNPGKQDSLGDFLNESEGYVIGWQMEDRNTVADYLQKLMFAANIIKQVYFRPAQRSNNLTKSLERLIKNELDDKAWQEFLELINASDSTFAREAGQAAPKVEVKEVKRGTSNT